MSEQLVTVHGKARPMQDADLPDEAVAGIVRMLMRDQLDHERVCTMARDRILYLSQTGTTLRAENARLRRALEFYAAERSWSDCLPPDFGTSPIWVDQGARARAVLKGEGE